MLLFNFLLANALMTGEEVVDVVKTACFQNASTEFSAKSIQDILEKYGSEVLNFAATTLLDPQKVVYLHILAIQNPDYESEESRIYLETIRGKEIEKEELLEKNLGNLVKEISEKITEVLLFPQKQTSSNGGDSSFGGIIQEVVAPDLQSLKSTNMLSRTSSSETEDTLPVSGRETPSPQKN